MSCFFYEFSSPGYYQRKFPSDSNQFCGQALSGSSFSQSAATVAKLLACMNKRYSDITGNLMAATKIINIQTWPSAQDMKDGSLSS